jgi:hypothetical protein
VSGSIRGVLVTSHYIGYRIWCGYGADEGVG